jgi:4-amino-4-deoxy-L-arabinose transferase-like glycosyltransferase
MQKADGFTKMLCALFALGIGCALLAALSYNTQMLPFPYAAQALLLLAGSAVVLFLAGVVRFGVRISRQVSGRFLTMANACLVVALLSVAYALRAAVIQNIPMEPASDFKTYYALGSLLAEDRLLTDSGMQLRHYVATFPHTIGFPALVLAPVFRLFGTSLRAALYANLLLSLGTVLLVYAIGRRLFGRLIGLMGMAAAAVWPSHVLYANMVASEPAFMLLLLLALYLLALTLSHSAAAHPRPVLAIAAMVGAGIFLGVANAVRPMALVMLIATCITCLFRCEKLAVGKGGARQILSRGWLLALVVALGFFVTSGLAAHRVRSLIRMEPASGLTAMGYNLMVGVNAQHDGEWNAEDAAFFDDVYAQTGSAAAAHQAGMAVAIDRIRQNPQDTLRLFAQKFRSLWQADDFGIEWNLFFTAQQGNLPPGLNQFLQSLRLPSGALYVLLLFLMLPAAACQWRQHRPNPIAMLGMLFFLGTALLHMVLETQARYHYNMIPFFILLGGYALSGLRKETLARALHPLPAR